MRLINVNTFELEEFDEQDCPRYAILSHRWEQEEVTYQDAVNLGLDSCTKKGIFKIRECCRLSQEHDVLYAWVDTCCIDKSSSAELSEAINSMFRWYQLAKVCIAFLSDVQVGKPDMPTISAEAWRSTADRAIDTSLWFTRAWTLQELIAPEHVIFYDADWAEIGSKATLANPINSRTGVPEDVLLSKADMFDIPVAERMAWARKRRCRRVEDTAYSLLGIFDVNMPLLYGEGKKAFRRLQEEIIKSHNDHTIFLWSARAQDVGRLLAPSPDCFLNNEKFFIKSSGGHRKPFSITNLGLSITLPLIPWHNKIYLALLDCEVSSQSGSYFRHQLGLYLRRHDDGDIYEKINFSARDYGNLQAADFSWKRTRDIFIVLDSSLAAKKSNNVNQGPNYYGVDALTHRLRPEQQQLYGFVVRSIETLEHKRWKSILPSCNIITDHSWDSEHRTLEMQPGTAGFAMTIVTPASPHIPRGLSVIKLGFDFDFHPVCIIGVISKDSTVTPSKSQSIQADSSSGNFPRALPAIKAVREIVLSDSHLWSNYNKHHIIPPSDRGIWLLKGDPLLGLSVTLGLHSGDYCVSGHQVKVRLTREQVHQRRTAWVFDLQISPCSGKICRTHGVDEDSAQGAFLVPPALIVTPPSYSPWSAGIDVKIDGDSDVYIA